jgi:hypothetical protein
MILAIHLEKHLEKPKNKESTLMGAFYIGA